MPEYLTIEELAKLLRTSPATVRYWRHVGKGPRSFKPGTKVLFAREDVEQWVNRVRDEQNADRAVM